MINRTLLFLFIIGTGSPSIAAVAGEGPVQPLRVYDEANPAPDHIYFRQYLQMLFDSDDPDDSEDGSFHAVLHGMGFDHRPEYDARARKMHKALKKRHYKLAGDIQRAEHRMLCKKPREQWTDDEIFTQMDKLADVRDRIAEKHYLNTMTMLDIRLAAALDIALQDGRTGFVSVRYPHKAMYENTGVNVRDKVESLCQRNPL